MKSRKKIPWSHIDQRIKELLELLTIKKQKQTPVSQCLIKTSLSNYFQQQPKSRFVVIGSSQVEACVMDIILENHGVPRRNIVKHLCYDEFKNKSLRKKYSQNEHYLFVVGPVPHKTKHAVGTTLDFLAEVPFGVRAETVKGEFKITRDSLIRAMGSLSKKLQCA